MKDRHFHKCLGALRPGSHLCCFYDSEEEHRRLIAHFVSTALDQNEKVLYILDTKSGKQTLDYLKNDGINFQKNIRAKNIEILNPSAQDLKKKMVDPKKFKNFIQNETTKAISNGYSGLRVTFDFSNFKTSNDVLNKCMESDKELNDLLDQLGRRSYKNTGTDTGICTAVCFYNIKNFKPERILDIFSHHPIVIAGDDVFYNFNQFHSRNDMSTNEIEVQPLNYTTTDLTELSFADNDLSSISDVVMHSMDSIFISDLDGKIIDVNKPALELCECNDKTELIGDYFFNYLAPDSTENDLSINDLKEIVQEGFYNFPSHDFISRAGKKIPVETSIDLMKNDNGNPVGYIGILRNISERKEMEGRLKEFEEKYRTLFDSSPEGIALISTEGNLIDCNSVLERLIGMRKSELIGRSLTELNLFAEDDVSKLIEIIPKELPSRSMGPIDMSIKFGPERGWVEVYPALLKTDSNDPCLQIIVKDITERKQTEEDMKRRLMKFILDDGKVYLVSETLPARSLEAFKDLLRIGYHGLALSRSPEREFRKMLNNGHFDFIWLAEDKDKDTIPPKMHEIESQIEMLFKSKPDRFAVYINRLDYLIFKNSFKKTLNFIQRLRELAYVTNNIIIVSIDPTTLNDRESRQLEIESNEIKPRLDKKMLAEEQFRMLRYIYESNIVGFKPSYTDIGSELGISKPTVRKRIRILLNGGYVMEYTKGRNKFLELTQAGKNFFVK